MIFLCTHGAIAPDLQPQFREAGEQLCHHEVTPTN
jgi:hypothetical protein